MPANDFDNLYSLLHRVSLSLGRGPRQGRATAPGQNKILKILSKTDNGEMLQRELLDVLGIRAASLSELLKKLEREGYVTREKSRSGGNNIVVKITETGRISALERRLSEKERDAALFECLTKQERKDLASTLGKLLDAWESADARTEGQRREDRWRERADAQAEEQEIDELLNSIS
jgi:DNA-binding MarR family transcriptional regulator